MTVGGATGGGGGGGGGETTVVVTGAVSWLMMMVLYAYALCLMGVLHDDHVYSQSGMLCRVTCRAVPCRIMTPSRRRVVV